jgi:hypothetical protein
VVSGETPRISAHSSLALQRFIAGAGLLQVCRALLGFQGDLDFYAGVFFALKRVRNGGYFHRAVVTITGAPATGRGLGDGAAMFITIGGTSFGVAAYPADTLDTLAQRFVDGVNALFVGVCAAMSTASPPVPGPFTITTLSPINGFALSVNYVAGSPPSSPPAGGIAFTGDIEAGNEGTRLAV